MVDDIYVRPPDIDETEQPDLVRHYLEPWNSEKMSLRFHSLFDAVLPNHNQTYNKAV